MNQSLAFILVALLAFPIPLLAQSSREDRESRNSEREATTTFGYDHENQRVFKKVGSNATTTYANKYYNIAGATTTVHLFLPDGDLLATVETGSASGGSGSATSTGFKTTGTVEVSTGWSSFTTSSINTSDNSYASCSSICDDSDDAQTSDYTFGIPADGTIDGIEVSIEANESISTGNIPLNVSLSWNDGSSFTSTKTATVDGTSDATYSLGGAADTWGRSWDDAEFANGTFRARFDKQSTSDTLNVDQIRIKVYYTTAGSSGSSATSTRYLHTDHLGGINVSSDETGLAKEVVDFLPFGAERFRDGDSQDQRQFAGTERDQNTSLDYMINRYYSSAAGKFLSQDPVFWEIGQTNDGQRALGDPQLQNSYSYSRDNPVTLSDPEGRIVPFIIGAGFLALTAYDAYDTASTIADPNASLGTKLVAGGLFLSPVGEIKAGGKILSKADNLLRNAIAGARREAQFARDLAKQFPDASIQREVYLRNADGAIATDAFGSARRIDFAVIREGKVQNLYEVTSPNSNKASQIQKELDIRNNGGTFIKDRNTGNLIDVSNNKTVEKRIE